LLPKYENFEKLNIDSIITKYNKRFGNASGFNFVVVGKFDLDSIKPLLEIYLGGLPYHQAIPETKDVGLRPVKGIVKKEIYKGKEPKSMIRLFWNGEAPFSEGDQLKIQMLGEILDIKLTETLREEMGGIYSGGVFGSLAKQPYSHYTLGITLPCGPENVQKLIEATMAEILKIKTTGPLETDLNKVKETRKQQHLTDIRENGYWVRQLLNSMELGSNPENVLHYENRVNAITVKDLQAAANKYFDMKNYVQFVLNPEK
jgi:zinc protease